VTEKERLGKLNRDLDRSTRRTDRMLVLLTALAAGAVYLLTLAPTVSFWDSGEYITCSWIMGIPHPPGVPLFVLLGRFSTLLFSFIPAVAVRVNLMCLIAGTVSVALVTRLLQRWGTRLGFRAALYRPMSVVGALLSAWGYTIWRNNNATETYAMAHLFAFLALWVFDIWMERRRSGLPAGRFLLLVAYLITLSIANHLSALIVVFPIILMYILYAVRGYAGEWRSPGYILAMLGLMVLAFSVHLYMPLRAVHNPAVNETNPQRWPAFRDALARKQYGQVSMTDRKGPFGDQLKLYMEYLSWQTGRPEEWDRHLGGAGRALATALRVLLTAGVFYGLVALAVKRPDLFVLLAFIFLMASFFFVVYLNFKTGPEGTAAGEVRERDYFFGASFTFFSILGSIGLFSALRDLAGRVRHWGWALMVIPAVALAMNAHPCDRSDTYIARDYGVNLLRSCPEGAILITNGDNDTFPLWFAQGVEEVRQDVIVSNLSLMNTNWYVHQLLDRDPELLSYREPAMVDSLRPIFVWGPNFFHVRLSDNFPVTNSTDHRILRATFDQSWPWAVEEDGFAAVVPSDGRGNQGSIPMQDLLLFDMANRRPVHGRELYLAGTVSLSNRSYLEDYLEMEGLVYRVRRRPGAANTDIPRSWELFREVYSIRGFNDPSVYKCDQALQLTRNYAVALVSGLAQAEVAAGNPEGASQALELADSCFAAAEEEWAQLLTTVSLVRAAIIDGTQGPEEAATYLYGQAEQIERAAERFGRQRLSTQAMALSQEASQNYGMEQQMRDALDSLADGTVYSVWLGVEADMTFANPISARNRLEAYADTSSDHRLVSVMEERMDQLATEATLQYRPSLYSTGWYLILSEEYGDLAPLLERATDFFAKGRMMAGASGSWMVARTLPESERRLVQDYVRHMVSLGPDGARELAGWFQMWAHHRPGIELAERCLELESPALAWLALSKADQGADLRDEILQGAIPATAAAEGESPERIWAETMEGTP